MKSIISIVNEILFREDIEGLIQAGAPADEYANEATQIVAALIALTKEQFTEETIFVIVRLIWAKDFELSEKELEPRLLAIKRVAKAIWLGCK